MEIIKTEIKDLLIIQPKVFGDERGYFFESFNLKNFIEKNLNLNFVQDNISRSKKRNRKRLALSNRRICAGKLCQAVYGKVLDVSIDIRFNSPTFGKHFSIVLSEENHKQIYIPPGFAHGFSVLSDEAIFQYKCTNYYNKESERSILYNDPDLNINWKVNKPIISEKYLGKKIQSNRKGFYFLMMLKAALNGARKKSEYSLIPQTPEELAHEAKKCIEAGAGAIHFHVYDKAGKESLYFKDVEEALLLLRETCPGIPFAISTGEWIVPDLNERLKLIDEWKTTPDFVSVNFDEKDVKEVCKILSKKNIKIEAGLSSQKDAENFLESNFIDETIRILIEPVEDSINDALISVSEVEKVLDNNKINIPRLLHGFENTAWKLIETAIHKKYDTRIGFEDTIFLPNGMKAKSNAELISHAISLKKNKRN